MKFTTRMCTAAYAAVRQTKFTQPQTGKTNLMMKWRYWDSTTQERGKGREKMRKRRTQLEGKRERDDERQTGIHWKSKLKPIQVDPFEKPVGPTFSVTPSP